MARVRRIDNIDESLITRVAALSPGTQRWLKTAIHAITTTDVEGPPAESRRPRAGPAPQLEPPAKRPASLEDVITGKADLREQLESYPELSEELDGLADIIDMLREAGDRRRKRGEQILREEILGQPPEKHKKKRGADGDGEDEDPGF